LSFDTQHFLSAGFVIEAASMFVTSDFLPSYTAHFDFFTENTNETAKKKSMMLGNAVSGVKFTVSLQLLTRVFTFVLNTLVLRQVASSVFGLAAQLQLITNLTLFLSREAVRRALVRGGSRTLAWVALFPFGVVICPLIGWLWLNGASVDELQVPYFQLSVLVTLLATLVELLGEPAYARNLAAMRYRARFVIEGVAVLGMCATLFVSVTVFSLGLLSWALGQLVFAALSTIGNFVAAASNETTKEKAEAQNQTKSDVGFWLLVAFQWQASQQVLLQEGERLLLKVSSTSLSDQGLYAIVANLGSLLVRSIFLPLEDVAGTYFSRLLLTSDSNTKDSNENNHKLNTAKSRDEASAVLRVVLHLLTFVSLLLVAFGPPLSFVAIDFLYGARISNSDAPAILSAYCL
jgi:oligosaccharide translocation protein RFT1